MENITFNGQPLAAAVAKQQTEEITREYQQEIASISKAVAHRKPRSGRAVRRCGGGRPKSGHSLMVLDKIIPLLNDQSLTKAQIAARMNMKVGEVKHYQDKAGIERKRGRKPAR
jgi:hypothetical protein